MQVFEKGGVSGAQGIDSGLEVLVFYEADAELVEQVVAIGEGRTVKDRGTRERRVPSTYERGE